MTDERIEVTHVGSLVRPPEIVDLATAIENGAAVDEAQFDRVVRAAIHDVVRHQKDVGVDVVSDGEFGKVRSWAHYVIDRLEGFEERDVETAAGLGKDARLFPEFYAEYFPTQKLPKRGVMAAVEPIRYTGHAAVRADIARFKDALNGVDGIEGFLPVVAPTSAVPRHANDYYASEEDFLFAVADAMHEEYKEIVDAGLYVQVDDAFLPYMYDIAFTDKPMSDYLAWAEMQVAAVNRALEGLPEYRVRYHICWGSFNTPHTTDVALADIVNLVTQVKAGAYCIEMANPRHAHEWKVWETAKLPAGRKLVPGCVSHSTNVVEHPELVAERLVRLAKLVGRENIMAGTDCGFSQSPRSRRVHESIQWAKLKALADGARIASQELWGRKAA